MFLLKTSSAQDGIFVNIGGTYFAPLKIENDNGGDTYLEARVFFPSPLLEVGYLKSLNDKDLNLGASFKTSFYHQGYTHPNVNNDTVSNSLKLWEPINMANFHLRINLEKGILCKKSSILYGSIGVGVGAMLVSHDIISIPFSYDTLQITGAAINNRMHFSPIVSAGLLYRIENERNNYWQFSIEYTQAFTDLGSRAYAFKKIETGKFEFRGSNVSFKVGYLFQSKSLKKSG